MWCRSSSSVLIPVLLLFCYFNVSFFSYFAHSVSPWFLVAFKPCLRWNESKEKNPGWRYSLVFYSSCFHARQKKKKKFYNKNKKIFSSCRKFYIDVYLVQSKLRIAKQFWSRSGSHQGHQCSQLASVAFIGEHCFMDWMYCLEPMCRKWLLFILFSAFKAFTSIWPSDWIRKQLDCNKA